MFLIKQKDKYLNIYKGAWVEQKSATLFKSYKNAREFDMWHLDSEIVEFKEGTYANKRTKQRH